MDLSELQRHVVGVLERLGVTYFITGSTATIFFGEPRFTNDLDVVAELNAKDVPGLLAAFPPEDFYLSEDAVRLAIAKRFQFNIIHPTSGLKVDVIIPADSELDRQQIARAVRVRPAPDYEASFSSPEDIIIQKLKSFDEGGSEKHLRDITGVMKILGTRVDRDYVTQWASRLGLGGIWQAVISRLETSQP